MPAVTVYDCSQLKEILGKLPELPRCNWLVTGLECYDNSGWEGCEKWGQREMFLTEPQLRHDVDLRDMRVIWGVFSAIPAAYSRDEVFACELPLQDERYMANRIVPQHKLAFLEIAVVDGWFVTVSAHDPALLQPLYGLAYKVADEEADNRKMNAQLRRVWDAISQIAPETSPKVANEVQWLCWHDVLKNAEEPVGDDVLHRSVGKNLASASVPGYTFRYGHSVWDPYQQMDET